MVDFAKYEEKIESQLEIFDPPWDLHQPELRTEVTTGRYKHTRRRNEFGRLQVLVKSVMVQRSQILVKSIDVSLKTEDKVNFGYFPLKV